jgi:hypothetical protein
VFEAYQNLKLKRGERDSADRCATLCTAYGFFVPQLTSFKLQDAYATQRDKGKRAQGRARRLRVS